MEQIFDLAIIGGGPGGYVAAERAGAEGLSTVLFERKSLGGVCLNEGCIPTKTLLYSAKVYNYAKEGDHYGVYTENPSFKYGEIVARKNKVVKKLVAGVKAAIIARPEIIAFVVTGVILGINVIVWLVRLIRMSLRRGRRGEE